MIKCGIIFCENQMSFDHNMYLLQYLFSSNVNFFSPSLSFSFLQSHISTGVISFAALSSSQPLGPINIYEAFISGSTTIRVFFIDNFVLSYKFIKFCGRYLQISSRIDFVNTDTWNKYKKNWNKASYSNFLDIISFLKLNYNFSFRDICFHYI